jgi:cyclic pyranopterin phosphate synthase
MTNLKVVNSTTLKDWAKAIFADNNFHMVDVSNKQNTHRKALAMGKIYVGQKTFKLIQNKQMPKGDPIALAEVAALLGVKKTSEIVPLCHPLTVDYSSTKIIQNENDYSLEVFCVVAAFAKTGVEMEAIMGVNAALTTIYDLSKIVNPDLTIDGIRLLIKQGGKSGTWINPHGLPEFLKDLF